MYKLAKSTIEI